MSIFGTTVTANVLLDALSRIGQTSDGSAPTWNGDPWPNTGGSGGGSTGDFVYGDEVILLAGNHFLAGTTTSITISSLTYTDVKQFSVYLDGVLQAADTYSYNSSTKTISWSTALPIGLSHIILEPKAIAVTSGGGSGGSGTVTSVSATGTDAFDVTVTNPTTTPAISFTLKGLLASFLGLSTNGIIRKTAGGYSSGSIVSVAEGGTGTATPSISPGTGISVSGSWPNQTVTCTVTGSSTDVLGTLLAGLSTATNAVITITDSVLAAFGKLQAQILGILTNGTLINPRLVGYREKTYDNGSGTSFTISLANGTVHICTLSGDATITLPAAVAETAYTVIVIYSGVYTPTFSGGTSLKWENGTIPTPTKVSSKMDLYDFRCPTSSYTLCSDSGRNF